MDFYVTWLLLCSTGSNLRPEYNGLPSIYSLQALQHTQVLLIKKDNLPRLYQQCAKYETIGRLMAELVAHRATEIAMSLASEKPEERYRNLLKKQPDLFQQVPQKFIANFLGMTPERLAVFEGGWPFRSDLNLS